MHYERVRRLGSIDLPPAPTDAERFWTRVVKSDGCWLWTGDRNDLGYGYFRVVGKRWRAHRYMLAVILGQPIDGLEVDHRCHNASCVRPEHLQAVTHQANGENRRGASRVSSTGVRGVFPMEKRKTGYFVSVKVHDVMHYGGVFQTVEEAEVAAIALRNQVMTNNLADRRPI